MHRDKKISYSFGVVSIVVFIFSFLAVLSMAISFSSANKNLEIRLTDIENVILNSGDEALTNDYLFNQMNEEIDALINQYDSFVDNLTIILSVFALLVAICTILMPIFTYNFLQKDQIESFHKKTADLITNFQKSTNATINLIQNNHQRTNKKINEKISDMESAKTEFNEWMDNLFSPLDFSEIRIEPVYNIPKEEIENYYKKAYLDFTYGKVDKSLEELELIIKSDPYNKKALLAKAQVLYSIDKYDEASTVMDVLINTYNDSLYYYIRGCIKFKSKNYESAINDFKYVYNNNPKDEQNLVKLAAALHKNHQTRDALSYQDKAIYCNGNVAQYYADRGIMQHALKNYPEALSDKKQAIELAKENSQYYGIYAATLYKLKRYEDAIDNANIAIEKEPNTAFAYSFRGLAKSNIPSKYNTNDVLSDLNQAITLDSSNHRNFSRRAEYYISVNDTDSALKDLETAVKLDSLDPEVMHLFSLVYELISDQEKFNYYNEKANKLGYIQEN